MSALGKYRILELAEGVSGECCGKLLSDFGAEVIKIERPGAGSPTRRMGPFGGGGPAQERSGLFAYLNTNKHSVELDLNSSVGAATLARLLDRVDVVIDDHESGWLESVGLAPAFIGERWPGLVICSITAYGQNPPPDRRHAEDLTVFHSSGWGYHTPGGGYEDLPPLKGPGRFQVSYEAGMDAAMCVVAALFEREASQLGRFIDVSKHEVMASRSDYVLAQLVGGDLDVGEGRGIYDLHGPSGIFPCRDGYIYVWMATPNEWAAYQKLVGQPEWAKDLPVDWLMMGLTPERIALCRRDLCEWLKTKGKDEAAVEAQKLGLALVPLNNTEDLMASPQYQHRKYFVEVDHPTLGTVSFPTVPYRLSETPARINTPAPKLGQHTEQQLAALGPATDEEGKR